MSSHTTGSPGLLTCPSTLIAQCCLCFHKNGPQSEWCANCEAPLAEAKEVLDILLSRKFAKTVRRESKRERRKASAKDPIDPSHQQPLVASRNDFVNAAFFQNDSSSTTNTSTTNNTIVVVDENDDDDEQTKKKPISTSLTATTTTATTDSASPPYTGGRKKRPMSLATNGHHKKSKAAPAAASLSRVVEILDDDEPNSSSSSSCAAAAATKPLAAQHQHDMAEIIEVIDVDITSSDKEKKLKTGDNWIAAQLAAGGGAGVDCLEDSESRKKSEAAAMMNTVVGRAWELASEVLKLRDELTRTANIQEHLKLNAIATDDIVYLAEQFMDCHLRFRSEGRPSEVTCGYHYTHKHNLSGIRRGGLMSSPERRAAKLGKMGGGTYFGDGIYTGRNPRAFSDFGDTGLLVAILRGNEKCVLGHAQHGDDVNTLVGNKKHRKRQNSHPSEYTDPNELYFDEVVLRKSAQCLPLLSFEVNCFWIEQDYETLFQCHVKLQQLLDRFFNVRPAVVLREVHSNGTPQSAMGFNRKLPAVVQRALQGQSRKRPAVARRPKLPAVVQRALEGQRQMQMQSPVPSPWSLPLPPLPSTIAAAASSSSSSSSSSTTTTTATTTKPALLDMILNKPALQAAATGAFKVAP